jgi:hypothetical protein
MGSTMSDGEGWRAMIGTVMEGSAGVRVTAVAVAGAMRRGPIE